MELKNVEMVRMKTLPSVMVPAIGDTPAQLIHLAKPVLMGENQRTWTNMELFACPSLNSVTLLRTVTTVQMSQIVG